MAIDDCNLDIGNLQDLMLENLEKGWPSYGEFPESQLCVPPDPIEDLEWFPSFVDDFISLNGVGLTPEHESCRFATAKPNQPPPEDHSLVDFPEEPILIDFPVTPEQHDEKATQGVVDSKQVTHENSDGVQLSQDLFAGFATKKARTKNQKRKYAVPWVKKRCSHCQTEETPQWRAGPMGPKTLCNACGVRFKSGRLLPEYRPAMSPTFDSSKHSNYHRKILKRLTSN